MYYKTLHERLTRCGWTIEKEYKNGTICIVEYTHERRWPLTDYGTIRVHAFPKKDGTPGRIFGTWLENDTCTSAFVPH